MASSASESSEAQRGSGEQCTAGKPIHLPSWFVEEFEGQVAKYATRMGETPDEARRGLQLGVLAWGLAKLKEKLER